MLRRKSARNNTCSGQFTRGTGPVAMPFTARDGHAYRLGPMICYEDILPEYGRRLAPLRPDLFVNITNDAWFGDTAEPWAHGTVFRTPWSSWTARASTSPCMKPAA